MKYVIDRIEGEIAILENLDTKEKKEENISHLPKEIKEGSILIFSNDEYKLNLELEKERRKSILEKFNRLKKKD